MLGGPNETGISFFQFWREWQLCDITLEDLRGGQMTTCQVQLAHIVILSNKKFRSPLPTHTCLWISYHVSKGKLLLPNFKECIYYYSLAQIPLLWGREYFSCGCEWHPVIIINTIVHIRGNSHFLVFFPLKTRTFPKRIKQKGWRELK